MDACVLDGIDVQLEASNVARRLHAEKGAEDYAAIQDLVGQATSVAKPRAMYKVAYVDGRGEDLVSLDGVRFRSRVLRVNLDDVHRVFPYVVTCGTELDDWSARLGGFVERYWADCIKEMILASAIKCLHDHIRQEHGLGRISAMNPGSLPDWPLSEQEGLFRLIGDVYGSIGVRLSESLLMIPTKSVSGIYFPTETSYENCQLCPRPNCPGRRAPYDERLYREKFAKR